MRFIPLLRLCPRWGRLETPPADSTRDCSICLTLIRSSIIVPLSLLSAQRDIKWIPSEKNPQIPCQSWLTVIFKETEIYPRYVIKRNILFIIQINRWNRVSLKLKTDEYKCAFPLLFFFYIHISRVRYIRKTSISHHPHFWNAHVTFKFIYDEIKWRIKGSREYFKPIPRRGRADNRYKKIRIPWSWNRIRLKLAFPARFFRVLRAHRRTRHSFRLSETNLRREAGRLSNLNVAWSN